jgi:hypothetical protein
LPHEHPKLGAIATANLTGHDFATFVLNLHMRKERMAHGESMHLGAPLDTSRSRTPLCGGYKEHGDPLEAVGARARSDGHNRNVARWPRVKVFVEVKEHPAPPGHR